MGKEGKRQHFAVGDYVTRFPIGSPYEIRIDCLVQKSGWKPRPPWERNSPTFPGTAIQFESQYYEIVSMQWESNRVCYYLNSWDERFPIRDQYLYTPEECRKMVALARRQEKLQQQTVFIYLLMPLVGMLPESDQLRIEKAYGIQAMRLTLVSALVLLFPGGYAFIMQLSASLGGTLPGPPILFALGTYLFIESWVRLFSSARSEQPIGSLVAYVPLETFRAIRDRFDPAYKQKRFEKMQTGRRSHDVFMNARDEVTEVPGEDQDLEIVSILPKPHWSPSAGINYLGTWYGLVESQTLREGANIRYKFLLKKASPGMVFRTTCNYTPEEIRELYRAKRLQDMGTWVETFSFLWGLLDGKDQKKLAEIYDYSPLKFTGWTILALGLAAFFNLSASLLNLASGIGTPLDALLILPSGYFLIESYSRFTKWRANEPSGSLLGALLRPLASRFFE